MHSFVRRTRWFSKNKSTKFYSSIDFNVIIILYICKKIHTVPIVLYIYSFLEIENKSLYVGMFGSIVL